MNIAKDCIVAIDFTLTNDAGDVLDTSEGKSPLVYLHGSGGLIPGLEAQLDGKSKGDQIQAVVAPELAYGPRHEDRVIDVPRDRFPEDLELEVGMTLQAQSPGGVQMVRVVAIADDSVNLDGNHPLAGETLHFDVKIMEVREATPQELAQAQASCGSHGSCCDEGQSCCGDAPGGGCH